MNVKAAKNPVPREDNSTRYITADQVVEVPASTYYLRRLADGELVEVVASAAPQVKPDVSQK